MTGNNPMNDVLKEIRKPRWRRELKRRSSDGTNDPGGRSEGSVQHHLSSRVAKILRAAKIAALRMKSIESQGLLQGLYEFRNGLRVFRRHAGDGLLVRNLLCVVALGEQVRDLIRG